MATVIDRPEPAATAHVFRTCEVTGLKLHRPAEQLIRANAVAASTSVKPTASSTEIPRRRAVMRGRGRG